ncbi:glycosyltransferase family 2 protein [Ramlibacter sp. XY19]|uniref:glycosyltransferase family 2 protein n=1 Tax=Ramlibacter paludis TaxID=2908000 RepID=UPI0023D9E682|nr:glycosyltransferase family 2 protein [Ramlibacter paludis]MCG2594752.1 glycosyltransferase family 2 protein [Ramlibacter paludis]
MRVVVLMSTYRGERYVREQIVSILDQLPPEGRLIIRDDGSPDGTLAIIQGLSQGDARIEVIPGKNLGFVASFLALIALAPTDAEMVMLSDQDDVWLPDKVQRAWDCMSRSGAAPTLYCSRLQLVDKTLRPIGLSPLWPRKPSFANAVTENVVTGCTAALNPAAVALLREHGDLRRIYFHDWWLYLVVSAFGQVHFDAKPTILYRQHQGNAIGMGAGWSRYWTILRFLRKRNWVHIMFNQLANFRQVHGNRLPAAHRQLLDSTFDPHDWRAVGRLLLVPRRLRQTLLSDVLFRGIVALELLSGRGLIPPEQSPAA